MRSVVLVALSCYPTNSFFCQLASVVLLVDSGLEFVHGLLDRVMNQLRARFVSADSEEAKAAEEAVR